MRDAIGGGGTVTRSRPRATPSSSSSEAPQPAVAAAVAAQRGLAAEPWPPDVVVRVRMGLHTGEGVAGAGRRLRRPRRPSRRPHRSRRPRWPGARLGHDASTDRGRSSRPASRSEISGSIGSRTSHGPSGSASWSSPAWSTSSRRSGRSTRHRTTCRSWRRSFVGRRPRGRRGSSAAGHDSAADPDRSGRDRQDATGAPGRR